jgi:ankyrin repeat protein
MLKRLRFEMRSLFFETVGVCAEKKNVLVRKRSWTVKTKHVVILALTVFSAATMAGSAENNLQHKLLRALQAGDPLKAKVALTAGANPNLPLADGSLPLAWAVDAQSIPLVQLLLEQGAKPDVHSSDSQSSSLLSSSSLSFSSLNFSPLVVACSRGDAAIVEALLDAGAKVNRTTATGVSPLALCAGNSSLPVVKRLLELGAHLEAADDTGQTPLMWAAAKGQVETIQYLLARGANVNRKTQAGFTPLFFSIKSGNPQAPVVVLEGGGDADYLAPDGTSAVQLAMYQQQFEFAALLIKRGVDLQAFDRNGNQLLHAAILNQQTGLVNLLLAQGASPNALTGPSKVVWRYEVNFTSMPYVTYPKSPLLLAAKVGSADIMRSLVAAGSNTEFQAEDGTHVLHAAAQANPAALALALAMSPKPNITDRSGRTPLHVLLGNSDSMSNEQIAEMFTVLAKSGARIDVGDKNGRTALDIVGEDGFKVKTEFAEVFHSSEGIKL